ncbi:molybdenum cofactor guanylyltransferase [Halorarius halobius]|uniref:molybdenum cofactor guanylyltransferase n=1 Tax=Halorarius halobius TaxID=2962671 RepID=UPI0020CE7D02|nr:molybdenum cofactor guanylyltransferase [Halorarius halobius]
MPAGAILAGGRSTRFGDADKAVAELAGTPMIRRVADRLSGVVDALVVNCRRDQRAAIETALADYPHPVTYAVDPDPDEGPMAGIGTAMRGVARDTSADYAFVAACDMPFLDPGIVDLLVERAAGHDAAVPRPGEWYETTHAVYRADAMADACDAALDRGDSKILAPLEALDWVVVDEAALRDAGSLETFRNVNTREEFERAAADLG